MSGIGYICSAGETFDSVALTLYGDERYAYKLLSANPQLCRLSVFVGSEVLTVPTIEVIDDEYEGDSASASAPWR